MIHNYVSGIGTTNFAEDVLHGNHVLFCLCCLNSVRSLTWPIYHYFGGLKKKISETNEVAPASISSNQTGSNTLGVLVPTTGSVVSHSPTLKNTGHQHLPSITTTLLQVSRLSPAFVRQQPSAQLCPATDHGAESHLLSFPPQTAPPS